MHRPATTAGRLTVPHHCMAIGQPQIRYSDPSLPARPCGLRFAQCFEIANRVQYPRGPLRLRARYLGGAPRTIWLVNSQRQRPAGSNWRQPGVGAVGGSACLASTAAPGQANLCGSKFPFVCFGPSTKISARPVTKFQQKLLALIGYRGCPGVLGVLSLIHI